MRLNIVIAHSNILQIDLLHQQSQQKFLPIVTALHYIVLVCAAPVLWKALAVTQWGWQWFPHTCSIAILQRRWALTHVPAAPVHIFTCRVLTRLTNRAIAESLRIATVPARLLLQVVGAPPLPGQEVLLHSGAPKQMLFLARWAQHAAPAATFGVISLHFMQEESSSDLTQLREFIDQPGEEYYNFDLAQIERRVR